LTNRKAASETTLLAWIVGMSLVLQIGLMLYVGPNVYPDVIRSIEFGRDVMSGAISIQTHLDNTKAFIAPLLWYWVYDIGGLWGLRLLNVVLFAGLLVAQFRLGRELFPRRVALAGVFLVAFYPGSHRNVVVGEQADNMAALLLVLGVMLYVRRRKLILPLLMLGTAVLFKFWAVVFVLGFCLHILLERRFRPATLALLFTAAVPLLVLDLMSDWAGLRSFLWSLTRQQAYTSWQATAIKMTTTGLLAANVLAIWSYLRSRTASHRLLLLLSVPYFVYVLLARDPWAATFVMMACLAFSSFLITDLWASFGWRRSWVVSLLGLYLLAGVAVASRNMRGDARPLVLRDGVQAPAFSRSDRR
jgi:hypothetical protein